MKKFTKMWAIAACALFARDRDADRGGRDV